MSSAAIQAVAALLLVIQVLAGGAPAGAVWCVHPEAACHEGAAIPAEPQCCDGCAEDQEPAEPERPQEPCSPDCDCCMLVPGVDNRTWLEGEASARTVEQALQTSGVGQVLDLTVAPEVARFGLPPPDRPAAGKNVGLESIRLLV